MTASTMTLPRSSLRNLDIQDFISIRTILQRLLNEGGHRHDSDLSTAIPVHGACQMPCREKGVVLGAGPQEHQLVLLAGRKRQYRCALFFLVSAHCLTADGHA